MTEGCLPQRGGRVEQRRLAIRAEHEHTAKPRTHPPPDVAADRGRVNLAVEKRRRHRGKNRAQIHGSRAYNNSFQLAADRPQRATGSHSELETGNWKLRVASERRREAPVRRPRARSEVGNVQGAPPSEVQKKRRGVSPAPLTVTRRHTPATSRSSSAHPPRPRQNRLTA